MGVFIPGAPWKGLVDKVLQLCVSKMPLIWFDIAVQLGGEMPNVNIAVPIDKNEELLESIIPFPLAGGGIGRVISSGKAGFICVFARVD